MKLMCLKGYNVTYGGPIGWESQQATQPLDNSSSDRLIFDFCASYIFAFSSAKDAIMIYSAISPFCYRWRVSTLGRDMPFSISAGGRIYRPVFWDRGIEWLSVLIEHFKSWNQSSQIEKSFVKFGAKERLRPRFADCFCLQLWDFFYQLAISSSALEQEVSTAL